MRQYEGYALEFAEATDDDFDAGWDFYHDGGLQRFDGGVTVSPEFDHGYAAARDAEEDALRDI